MKKPSLIFLSILSILAVIYLLICLLLYLNQEKLIFYPTQLPKEYAFRFAEPFEEQFIEAPDGTLLHGLLFRAEAARGLVFFLHGNAGALNGWGDLASVYTRLNYDVFMLDYRGYGKSEGRIKSQKQFYGDVQAAYQHMLARYREQEVVVVGFSIGSGSAAMLAAQNQPKMLILLAPYYSLSEMVRHTFPFVPTFLLKYKFRIHQFLDESRVPVYIFHGTRDEVIPYASSQKLQKHLKPGDRFISLEGQDHNGIHGNRQFLATLAELLLPSRTP